MVGAVCVVQVVCVRLVLALVLMMCGDGGVRLVGARAGSGAIAGGVRDVGGVRLGREDVVGGACGVRGACVHV
jgi:hypothetical protein